jgi:hypothetical protein
MPEFYHAHLPGRFYNLGTILVTESSNECHEVKLGLKGYKSIGELFNYGIMGQALKYEAFTYLSMSADDLNSTFIIGI